MCKREGRPKGRGEQQECKRHCREQGMFYLQERKERELSA